MSHATSQTHATATQTTPHRLLYFFVAFVLLMFFGLIYAWSLFVDPLEAEFGWDRSATSVVFTLSIITFCAGMLVAGALEERTSPRTVMLITAACLGLGLIASAFTESLPFIYTTYGVLVGAGVGLGTDVVMSVTLKWFPDKQGLASGAMLMGFGGGTMLLSPVVTTMLGTLGWRLTFGALGVIFVVLVGAGAFIMKLPTPEYVRPLLEKARQNATVAVVDMTGGQMVRTPTFWVFMVYLMLVTCGGLALISQAVPAAMELLMGAGAAASGAASAGAGASGAAAAGAGFLARKRQTCLPAYSSRAFLASDDPSVQLARGFGQRRYDARWVPNPRMFHPSACGFSFSHGPITSNATQLRSARGMNREFPAP